MGDRQYFLAPHQKTTVFGGELYDVKVPTTIWVDVNTNRSFLSPNTFTHTWNGKTYNNLNELRLDLIEARVIQKSRPNLKPNPPIIGDRLDDAWKPTGITASGGAMYTAPVGTPEPTTEKRTWVQIGNRTMYNGDTVDLRVTRDGEYWIGPVNQPTASMYGWRKINIGQVHIPKPGEREVHFYNGDVTLKVNKIHGTNETTEVKGMRKSEALRSQAAEIARMIAEAQIEEAKYEAAMGREPVSDDPDTLPVIYWSENFGRENGPSYTYVAVKTNDRWFTTQRKSGKAGVYSWAEMVDEFHSIRHGDFWMASKWVHAE